MNYRDPSIIGGLQGITPCVQFLLMVNIIIFFGEFLDVPFKDWFKLPINWWESFSFAKLFTYMFVHADFEHILVNMLGLFFVGPVVERTIGSYKFFILYYLSGILGGLAWSLAASSTIDPPYDFFNLATGTFDTISCLGASGAVMGILGAFGAFYPNTRLLLWFIIPIRAWILVLGLVILEIYLTIQQKGTGGVANSAHAFGLITGISYAIYVKYKVQIQSWFNQAKNINPKKQVATSDQEVNRILDKIGKEGMGSLTNQERKTLQKATHVKR